MGFFDFVENAADDVGNAVSDGVDAVGNAISDVGNAVSDGANAVGNAASDAVDAVGNALGDAPSFVVDLGSQAIDTAENFVFHPITSAERFGGLISQGAHEVGSFVSDHSREILTGAEIAAGVALTPELGPVGGALLAAGIAAAADIADGKSAEDTLVDALAAGADKFIPGSGHAAEAVVNGIEHGESVQQIAEEAGLGALGGSDSPALGFAATFADDLAHGRDPGQTLLDLGSQYAGYATDGNPLGEAGVIAARDIMDGKSPGDVGLDLAKAYLDNAAGGDGSPTGQLINTFFDGVSRGESAPEILGDMFHTGVNMAERAQAADPGAFNDALGDIPGGKYATTFVDDVLHGKPLDQSFEDAGRQVVGEAFGQSGLGDAFKEAGLGPFRPYIQTAADDLAHGKSFEQIAEHAGTNLLGDAFSQGGLGTAGFHPDWAELNPQPLPPMPDPQGGTSSFWTKVGEAGDQLFSHAGIHPDWAEVNPQPLPPGPDPEGGTSSFWTKVSDLGDQVLSHVGIHPDWTALNPQPLPPGPDPESGIHLSDLGSTVALNPQPLPPGPDPEKGIHLSDAGSAVSLNPQPLPPGPDPETGFHLSDAVLTHGPDPAVHAILGALNPAPVSDFQDYGVMATHYEPPLH